MQGTGLWGGGCTCLDLSSSEGTQSLYVHSGVLQGEQGWREQKCLVSSCHAP